MTLKHDTRPRLPLSDQQLLRYHRQISLKGVDIDGQAQLAAAHVLVVGLGGLGCAAAQYLALAGVGRLSLVDGDQVELTNLQRQVLHEAARLGQPKVHSAATAISRLNPDCQVSAIAAMATADNLTDWLAEVDLVLDCTDNRASRNLINAACHGARVPLISGAAIRLEGQVSVFTWGAEEPCYACLSRLYGEQELSCVEAGVLAPVVGLVGSLQAMEALKLLLRLGQPLSGRLLLIDGLTGQFETLALPRHPGCPCCGQAPAAA